MDLLRLALHEIFMCAKGVLNTLNPQKAQQDFLFDLQPDRNVAVSHAPPPIMPKLQRSRKESQEPMITADQHDINGRS